MFEIASQIPPRAKRVVELGCGKGESGAAFLRRQPEAIYWGLTAEEEELRTATEMLSHAAYVLPEELDLWRLGIYEADVIVVRGAYLRCMTADRLKKLADSLTDEGLLLMLPENPGYVRHLLAELGGEKNSAGCLARENAINELKEAGFAVLSVQGLYSPKDKDLRSSEAFASFKDSLAVLCREVGQEVQGADLFAHSFLIKARKKPLEETERLLVHTALGETIVTPKVRVIDPGMFMSTEPGVMAVTEDRHNLSYNLEKHFARRVFIRQRISFTDVQQAMDVLKVLRNNRFLILSEVDDNPFVSVLKDSIEPVKELSAEQELSFLGLHGVQVSTEALAELVRPYNPHVAVMRNELTELPKKRNYMLERHQRLAKGENYVTFFFGALNRTREWQEVMPVISEAIERYGAKLRFKVLSDKGFYEALPTEYKEFIGSDDMYGGQFVPYDMYQAALHSSDISFLPLRETEFNRTKSDLKFIESAGHGAVVLASPTVYEATVRDGRTGFIYRNPQEFGERLRLLVENSERRIETAEAAYNYVRQERLLANHYMERLAWYREMADRWQELDKEVSERVAEWQRCFRNKKGGKS